MRHFDPIRIVKFCKAVSRPVSRKAVSRSVPAKSGHSKRLILQVKAVSRHSSVPPMVKCLILKGKSSVPVSPLTGGIAVRDTAYTPDWGLGPNDHPIERIFHPGRLCGGVPWLT